MPEGEGSMPAAFTFPFCYEAHPWCLRAAAAVRDHMAGQMLTEGKMFGVLVVQTPSGLAFLAAYSGQLNGHYRHPWFVPPVVDYLDPTGHFQQEQRAIVAMGQHIQAELQAAERADACRRLSELLAQRKQAVAAAQACYDVGKRERDALRRQGLAVSPAMIAQSQRQKGDLRRARQLNAAAIAEAQAVVAHSDEAVARLTAERRQRSEALQQWLFRQFAFSDATGRRASLTELFAAHKHIPSGAGECCAPKLLQAAYDLRLTPVAMAEFWLGPPSPQGDRREGVFYPACQSKCRPILTHMLGGLTVEPDPTLHYNSTADVPRVLWQDAWLAVMHKPAGWLSVQGRADVPNMADEARRLWPELQGPAVVHRLDQDTSGLLVVAKNRIACRAMQHLFATRQVAKRYVALLDGVWPAAMQGGRAPAGTIELPLAPSADEPLRQCVDREHGVVAVSRYEVIGTECSPAAESVRRSVTRIALWPATGRTHQLRLHAAADEGLGIPILGDRLYGHIARRLYLHAESISFTHPVSGETVALTDECPF